MTTLTLRQELGELALVAGGAIPGALLRWQLTGLIEGDFVANMAGCLILGLLLARPRPGARLVLWGGIGFCGSLTTFSSWMLELVRALDQGDVVGGLRLLLSSLIGGLVLVGLGSWLGGRWFTRAADAPGSTAAADRANRAGR